MINILSLVIMWSKQLNDNL